MSRFLVLKRSASCWPKNTFTYLRGEPVTYVDALDVARRMGAVLKGLHPEPVVATLSGNDPLLLLASFGVAAAGGTSVALGAAAKPEANQAIVEKARPSILLVDEEHRADADRLVELVAIEHVITMDSRAAAPSEFEKLYADATPVGDVAPPALDHIVGFGSTGGTTGLPKVAPATSIAIDMQIANAWGALDLGTYRTVHLVVAPISHAAGSMALILTPAGATHLVLPKFDAGAVIEAIREHQVTDIYLPPTAIYGLLADPEIHGGGLGSLRHIFYAGAPMSAEKLREGIEVLGPVFTQFYGQAEVPLTATCLTPAEHEHALREAPHRLLSAGRPTLFTDLAILNDDDTLASVGQNGEVGVRGNLAMWGYVGDRRRRNDEYHRTGDVGHLDEDGYLYLVDRKRDVIVSGGFNVFPIEVEQVIWANSAVEDCAVIGIPDEKWGEAVTAVVQIKPGMSVSADELIAACREALGPIKAPKRVDFVDALPKSPVGKVLKRDLREKYWVGQERRI
ncbi:MAG: AMP-binding protein [Ilumatobacteraceae bacterium]